MESEAGNNDNSCSAKANNESKSPFSDPVYHQLSRINGQINKMTRSELLNKLKDLNLDTRGNKEVLKKRIKSYYKRQKLSKAKLSNQVNQRQFDYLCFIDFEATCCQQNSPNYRHEIIEFPAVLLDVSKRQIVDKFHRFCCPVINPMLSSFCTNLTGITQSMVNNSPKFATVLKEFEEWLASYQLGKNYSFAIVTDGPWDMGRFLYTQCQLSSIPYPHYAKKWINMRKIFSNFYGSKRQLNIEHMLEYLGLRFEGRPHSGLDDASNVARIVIHLLGDGAQLRINERLDLNKEDKQSLTVSPVLLPEFSNNINSSLDSLKLNVESNDEDVDTINGEEIEKEIEK